MKLKVTLLTLVIVLAVCGTLAFVAVANADSSAGIGNMTYSDTNHDYNDAAPIANVTHTYDKLGICTTCGSESALYISATEANCKTGETFEVELNIERNCGIFYLSLYARYDADALELVSIENGDIFNLTTGNIYIWNATAEDIDSLGTLGTFTFKVKEDAAADTTYPIEFFVYECCDENEEDIDAVTGDGSVYVFDYVYGDANGDGLVNGIDVTRLLRYLASFDPIANKSPQEIEPGADCNGDGVINGKDATRLLLYLANLDPTKPSDPIVPDSYTVTFLDHDGTVLKTQTVLSGKSATAPADPSRAGYVFIGWDKAFDKVLGNLTVTALYEQNNTPTLTVGNVTAKAGDYIEIPVSITNNPGLLGMSFSMTYNDSIILIDWVEEGSDNVFRGLNLQEPARYKNDCNLIWYGSSLRAVKDGEAMIICAKIADDAPAGTYTFKFSGDQVFDQDDNQVTLNYIEGTITVTD